jgi:hypothetical protein
VLIAGQSASGKYAEGMALFAEFDLMVTGFGKVVSAPVASTAAFFSLLDGKAGDFVKFADSGSDKQHCPELVLPFLFLRTLPTLIDRKSNLLSSPLSTKDGSYLLG